MASRAAFSLLAAATPLQAELLAQQCAMSYAMFLYVVQHAFEGVYRVPRAQYNRAAAALLGSSYLSVPRWWAWATLGVEYHHIHHLNARVPCYRLKVGSGVLGSHTAGQYGILERRQNSAAP